MHTKTSQPKDIYNFVRSAEMIEAPGIAGPESQKNFILDFFFGICRPENIVYLHVPDEGNILRSKK